MIRWSPLQPTSWLAQTDGGQDASLFETLRDQLLGLSRLSWGDGETVLGWRYPLPAWAWALIVLAALGLAAWSYSRLMGPRPVRAALAGVRGLLLVVIVALLAGPTLVRHDERIEQDWLLVLVDRSASMQVRDTLDADTGRPLSRDEALRRALGEQLAVFAGEEGEEGNNSLAERRHVAWLGFGGAIEPILAADQAPAWAEPTAQITAIRSAIEQALQQAAGRPISGIVLFSDGRSPEPGGAELIHRLQQQAVSVFSVPLGAHPMPLDLAVGQVDAPERAFADDLVPVTATVEQISGGAGDSEQPVDPAQVRLRLVDETTGAVLDQRTLEATGLGRPARLQARPSAAGQARWRVEVVYEGPGESADQSPDQRELITANNRESVVVEVVDRPLRVLYIEGYPRWEYRYLKNMLIREKSIASSMMLLSADREFAQEGDEPITRLPRTAEELAEYDVLILGDVGPGNFTSEQITLLRDHVASRGAGLLWIGGQQHNPVSYQGTPLADLLPMRRPETVAPVEEPPAGLQLQPTSLARALSVLILRDPDGQVAGDDTGWPMQLPALRWAQLMGPLKPAAEVLASATVGGRDAEMEAESSPPLIARLRYGAGQSLFVGTDETWRWRYGRGDLYFQQFWIQLVRMLGRGRLDQTNEQVRLTVSHRRLSTGQTAVVELIVEDPATLQRQLPQVAVAVEHGDGDGDGSMGQAASSAVDQLMLRPVADEPMTTDEAPATDRPRRVYRAQWQPRLAGEMVLRVVEPALDDLELLRPVEVIAPDDERRHPQPDHARLAHLAEQTGGEVVPLNELGRLTELVPNRERRTPNDLREPLWNAPLALVVVLILLTGEWVLRKVIRLV